MTKAASQNRGRVLHVLTALDYGGVESQMRLIAANASSSGWDRAFCAIGPGGASLAALHAMGVEACALGRPVRIPSVRALWALWRHIRQLKPDVVHLHGAEANFHGVLAARLAGVAVVIAEEVGIPAHSSKARKIFAWIYRRCERVVAISAAVKDSIVAQGEAADCDIEVIHNPFQPQPFKPFPARNDGLELGFVGRLEPVKNPTAAIDAIALLRDRGIDARLRIVGDGSQRPLLERRIAALGLGPFVRLDGFQPDPFEKLAGCHIYLQPSLTEGFGLAICEAMSAGIPVIASAVGGAPEIITHGRTGWLIATPDARVLADRIAEVAALDDATLSAVAVAARDHVNTSFGAHVYMQRCDDLYRRLTDRT